MSEIKAGDTVRRRSALNPARMLVTGRVVRVWVPKYGRRSAKGASGGAPMARVLFEDGRADVQAVSNLVVCGSHHAGPRSPGCSARAAPS